MKKLLIPLSLAVAVLFGLSGCVAAIGNRDGKAGSNVTLGQQLIDLQRAKDAGAMTEAEYLTQKAKLLGEKRN